MIVYGKNVIREIVYNKREIYKLYIDNKFNDYDFLNFLKNHNIRYTKVAKDKLNELTNNNLHQGIVCDCKPYEYKKLSEVLDPNKKQNIIILDGINDPHNFGAILRTAEASGISFVVMANKNQVPLNATVAKTSSGAIEHVPVCLTKSIKKTINTLKEQGFLIIGTDGSAKTLYNKLPKGKNLAVILGNEGYGIRPFIKESCDLLVKIPMNGKINSLNVSVAGALLMYELIKNN